jgi:hypothetical protein
MELVTFMGQVMQRCKAISSKYDIQIIYGLYSYVIHI